MEKSQYNEMIRLLNEEKKVLVAQLAEIEKAMASLANLKNGVGVARLTDDIITNKKDVKDGRKNYYENVVIDIPLIYQKDLQTLQLFFFALNKLGEGTVEEIKNYVMGIDPDKDEKHILGRFRDIASGLFRANKIYANTSKKQYRYSLKELKVKELSFDEKIEKEIDEVLNL